MGTYQKSKSNFFRAQKHRSGLASGDDAGRARDCNAIFGATGARVAHLPIRPQAVLEATRAWKLTDPSDFSGPGVGHIMPRPNPAETIEIVTRDHPGSVSMTTNAGSRLCQSL